MQNTPALQIIFTGKGYVIMNSDRQGYGAWWKMNRTPAFLSGFVFQKLLLSFAVVLNLSEP